MFEIFLDFSHNFISLPLNSSPYCSFCFSLFLRILFSYASEFLFATGILFSLLLFSLHPSVMPTTTSQEFIIALIWPSRVLSPKTSFVLEV